MAQHVDLFVDRCRFFDVGIGDGDVGFGLVVVVITNEIFDGVVGEEFPQLVTELSGKGFVVGEDEGGFANLRDRGGNGESFPGSCGPQQGLVAMTLLGALDQLRDRAGLISRWFKWCVELKLCHTIRQSFPGSVLYLSISKV